MSPGARSQEEVCNIIYIHLRNILTDLLPGGLLSGVWDTGECPGATVHQIAGHFQII